MAVTIKRHRFDYSKAIVEPMRFIYDERVLVEGLDATPNLMFDALTAPGLPQPNAKLGIKNATLASIEVVRAVNMTSVELCLHWVDPGRGVWQVHQDCHTTQASWQIDKDGKPCQITFASQRVGAAPKTKKTLTFRKQLPLISLRANIELEESLADTYRDQIGMVNDKPWRKSGLGFGPKGRTGGWLLIGIKSTTRDGMHWINNEMTFLYDPRTWAARGIIEDEFHQKVLVSAADALRVHNAGYETINGLNGIGVFQPYGTFDFNLFGIPDVGEKRSI